MRALLDGPLLAARDAVHKGDCSATELTQAALARIAELQPRLNFAIALWAEEALEAARGIDQDRAAGKVLPPLAGIPLMHKDMLHRAGKVSTYGSAIFKDFVAARTASVMTRLDTAGAIDLGRLNMAEFAVGLTGHNRHHGDCRNPWNLDHVTGGSSSGSGAAVAARCVFGALGSDTGGSIRLPATLNGTVGLKPTQGRVSRAGVMPLSASLDCIGPLARTVADCALIFDAIAGRDPDDPTSAARPFEPTLPSALAGAQEGLAGLRIARAANYYEDDLEPEIVALMDAARGHFARADAHLCERAIPDHPPLAALQNVVMGSEAASVHRANLKTRFDEISPQVRARLLPGLAYEAAAYHDAIRLRPRIAHRFIETVFKEADILMVPSIPVPAPTLDETRLEDGPGMAAMIARIGRCTRPVNYLGLPALTVPAGFTRNGLPFGIQLIGRPFAEGLLMRAAAAFEARAGFLASRPAILVEEQSA